MKYRASEALEAFLLSVAPPHEAVLDAPQTFEELNAVLPTLTVWDEMPVYSGGCDDTIYSDPSVNHALRAWHDEVHFNEQQDFGLAGELEVAKQQVADAESMAVEHNLTVEDLNVLWLDLAGQALYYDKHKAYVIEQDRFVAVCLRDGIKAVLKSGEVF